MNFPWNRGRWLLLVCALGGVSCAQDPENYCASRVEQICKVLTDCCNSKSNFDNEACELQLSGGCESQLKVEEVHAGDFLFDEGAANNCFGTIDSCDSVTAAVEPSDDRTKACGNVLTGHRPAGAACTESAQCEKSGGDFPSCHGGQVCAKTILSPDECSFSFETNELRTCVAGKYCKVPAADFDPDVSPTKQALEFFGSCESYLGKGDKCLPKGTEVLPCETDLFCNIDPVTPKNSVCAALTSKGKDCSLIPCKAGLNCEFDVTSMKSTCVELESNGPYCYTPPDCGDGFCEEPYETKTNCAKDCVVCGDFVCDDVEMGTCPADCGGAPVCGDGFCDGDEATTCPDDCGGTPVCGNGTCEAGEVETCPADCEGGAVCGDGTCDFMGTEPATCPDDCCGDGYCDPGETAQICAADCG